MFLTPGSRWCLRESPLLRAISALYLLPLLLLVGCGGLFPRPDAAASMSALPPGVKTTAGRLDSATGCPLHYRSFASTGARMDAQDGGDLTILAPGFLRSQRRMRDLAATLARDGVPVATLDFCNQKPWAGRIVQNARDMQALARHLGAERVVYAGFSAGGLAALLAARADPKALGVVTLDLVETQGLGVRAARGLDRPLLALAGEPTNCNAQAKGEAVYAVAERARVRSVSGAGHCDFESPTDAVCALICEDPDGTRRVHRKQIIAEATAAVRALWQRDAAKWPGPALTGVMGVPSSPLQSGSR